MSSYNQACRKGDVQDRRIVNSGRRVMVAHDVPSDKEYVIRGAAAMAVGLRKFDIISGKKYGKPLDDLVCVCGFEKALLAGQLIDFGDPVRLVMNFIEQLSTCQLFHSRIVYLFFVRKFFTALVTGQENPAGAQLPCFPDEISKVESLLAF